jgi:hypothetical protein
VEKQYRVVQCNMTLLGGNRSDRVTIANVVVEVDATGIDKSEILRVLISMQPISSSESRSK